MFASIACFLALIPQVPIAGPGKSPAKLDRSGVNWARDFKSAREQARENRRLLFIIPDTWQPNDNGDFGPSLENFRVGVLCDERVRRLLNRRFVPYYCNIFEGAAAFDAEATKFVVKVKKEYGKETQTFTGGYPLLFMTSTGKLVGEISSGTTADQALSKMQKLLAKNSRFNARSKAEKALKDPIQKAELYFDLGNSRKARLALKGRGDARAQLWLASIARVQGRWKEHGKILRRITDDGMAEQVRLERARGLWRQAKFAELVKESSTIEDGSPQTPEARYLQGLGHFHLGDKKQALAVWEKMVKAHVKKQDPFVYRADWAYCEAKLGPRETWAYGKDPVWPSMLGRQSYLGWPHPDVWRKVKRKAK